MRNLPDWVVAFWATITVGAVAVPLNAWWTGDELAYGLSDSGSKVAFVDEERQLRISHHLADVPGLEAMIVSCEEHDPDTGGRRPAVGCTLERAGAEPLHVISFGDVVGTPADDIALPDVPVEPDDDATIFYTSGTTGRPKGAVGTHRNSCSNLMNLFFVATMGSQRRTRAQKEASPGAQNANLLSVPLFHATGCHALLVTNTAAGGKLVMMHHFDPERALELIERERITVFGGVPAMVMQVIDSPDFAKRDTSSVQSISYGGAPCPPDLVRRIKEHFPSGAPGNGYGLTETSAMTTMNTGDDYVRKPDSVGPPSPVCDVAVVPEEWEGTDPPEDQVPDPARTGELWIKGPNVVRGYWNRPDATASSFTNGWLHTGDVARIDEEGFVHIVDRAKDMIIRGGENVYCVEIEGALHEHPAVADCAVIGVPHPVLSEEVGAVIVLRPGMEVAADELSRHVRERLAAFNVPTRYWFRAEALPRNPAGKILKRELRTELLGDAPVF
ncbi:MAG TPA: class I adenylate-forming enzyme family protein, partial [Acidimicrobiales bacterium]